MTDEMKKALEPFAKAADRYNDIPGILRIHDDVELWQVQKNKGMEISITVGDLRRARSALTAGGMSLPKDRCDCCDNGIELEWSFCAWCGRVLNRAMLAAGPSPKEKD